VEAGTFCVEPGPSLWKKCSQSLPICFDLQSMLKVPLLVDFLAIGRLFDESMDEFFAA
jgi:hypothetical protein